MARQTFRANLGSADFPLLIDDYGRSVVVAKQDIHYIRPNAFSGAEADKNIGIPQMIFAENVLPFSNGYQSVGFTSAVPAGAFTDADQAFYLRDAAETKTLFIPAGGQCRFFNNTTATWSSDAKVVPAGSICSVANLKGRTFIHFSNGANFYEWNGAALPVVAITGLVPANILGIVAANSYLIAWDTNRVYWSSTLDPTDFTPSLSTGAGSEQILGLNGKIIYCKPMPDGFIIYASSGTHYARYTNNIRFPWNFTELSGSSGITSAEHAADAPHDTKYYVYTNNGLSAYERSKAVNIFPPVSEFLGGRRTETYDSVNKTIVTADSSNPLQVKVCFAGKRFLVISYGIASLTHALVYDAGLQRWGKIRIDHVDCFEFYGDGTAVGSFIGVPWVAVPTAWNAHTLDPWNEFGPTASAGTGDDSAPYRSIAFLKPTGEVQVVDFTHANLTDNAVMYLGRFQFIRDRLLTLQDVEAEGMGQTANDALDVLTSYDGNSIDKTTSPMLVVNKPGVKRWQMKLTGINHILRFHKNFRLKTVIIRCMLNGSW